MDNKLEDIMARTKSLFDKNPELSMYMFLLYTQDLVALEKKKDESITMGMWPVDIPKVVIEEMTKYRGEKFTTMFLNNMLIMGFEYFMVKIEENYKDALDEYSELVVALMTAVKEEGSESIVNKLGDMYKASGRDVSKENLDMVNDALKKILKG